MGTFIAFAALFLSDRIVCAMNQTSARVAGDTPGGISGKASRMNVAKGHGKTC